MLIEYHWKYMTMLAKRYLNIYSKYGYDDAKKWYDEFLTDGLRKRIRPFISSVAESQNLETD